MADSQTETTGVITALQNMLNGLGSAAEDLCKGHLEFVMAENKSKDWDNKSSLYVKPRMRGYGLTCNWYEVKWYGKNDAGTRRMSKKLIHKPKSSHSYTIAKLESHSQPWEVDMVREVEAGLAEIRRKAAIVSKALLYLKQLERLEAE